MTDPNAATTAYDYDELNRLMFIDYPAPDRDVTFTYDAVGRRLTMVDGLGTTTWTYDALDRPLTTTDPFDNTVTYTYNALGNRVTLAYPDDKVVSYAYDSAHRLDEIALDAATIAGYTYDAAGRVTGVTRANGVDTTYTYDDADRLTQLEHTSGSNELASYEYAYDDLGNRTQVVETYQQPDLDYIFNDGFEAGNTTAWSASVTGDGNLSATSTAASRAIMAWWQPSKTRLRSMWRTRSPAGDAMYHARFYLDPRSITIPKAEYVDIFWRRIGSRNGILFAAACDWRRISDCRCGSGRRASRRSRPPGIP